MEHMRKMQMMSGCANSRTRLVRWWRKVLRRRSWKRIRRERNMEVTIWKGFDRVVVVVSCWGGLSWWLLSCASLTDLWCPCSCCRSGSMIVSCLLFLSMEPLPLMSCSWRFLLDLYLCPRRWNDDADGGESSAAALMRSKSSYAFVAMTQEFIIRRIIPTKSSNDFFV